MNRINSNTQPTSLPGLYPAPSAKGQHHGMLQRAPGSPSRDPTVMPHLTIRHFWRRKWVFIFLGDMLPVSVPDKEQGTVPTCRDIGLAQEETQMLCKGLELLLWQRRKMPALPGLFMCCHILVACEGHVSGSSSSLEPVLPCCHTGTLRL